MSEKSDAASVRPVPWDYGDHREYLSAMAAHLFATRRGFSYRQFSKQAGFASPNYLRLVADGQKNLTPSSVARFARALGLNTQEREAFEALVMLGQATNDQDRTLYFERLKKRQPRSRTAVLDLAQFEMYTQWYILPVREMILLPDFVEDAKWVAKRLWPRITPQKADRALKLLERLGLAVRDANGQLRVADVKLKTPLSVRSLAIRNYHRAMLKIAERSLEKVERKKRHLTSVTIGLTEQQYEQVCERINEVRREILDLIEDAPKNDEPKEIHVIGFQVVPVTAPGEDNE